jgi:hypothetical protein
MRFRRRNHAARFRKAGLMQSSTKLATPSLPPAAPGEAQPRTREELVYQAVTVAAILLVLCSVWVF